MSAAASPAPQPIRNRLYYIPARINDAVARSSGHRPMVELDFFTIQATLRPDYPTGFFIWNSFRV
ncbi:MAG: hypothetical protein ACREE6_15255, partial [Limisphaerales bacterium]